MEGEEECVNWFQFTFCCNISRIEQRLVLLLLAVQCQTTNIVIMILKTRRNMYDMQLLAIPLDICRNINIKTPKQSVEKRAGYDLMKQVINH